MPYKDKEAHNRRRRENRAAKKQAANVKPAVPSPPSDPADALADWSKNNLVIPPGHPLAGQPLVLPDYGVSFLRDAMAAPESLLSIGRKNAKSAVVGVYLLGRLVGPLRMDGYRAGVVSVNRDKAGELYRQCEAIADASGLTGLVFRRAPMRIIGPSGDVDILSADKSAGHSSGYDDAIFDELGLIPERGRELVNGLRSAVSARNGRFLALSIQGDAPFTAEMLDRKGQPDIAVHHYAAADDAALDDVNAWYAANPGLLPGIKSMDYMKHASNRALTVPADAPGFRAYDLNLPATPSAAMLVQAADWQACETDDLPPMDGPLVLGVDLGSGYAMSAAAGYWPATGRIEGIAAFPDNPDLLARGRADGVGGLYQQMAARGELITTPGRVVNPGALIALALERYGFPMVVVCDFHRLSELKQALEDNGIPPSLVVTRRMGWGDGAEDCSRFQRAVLERRLRTPVSLVARSAIAGARTVTDKIDNTKLAKGTEAGRRSHHKDDFAAAMLLAVAEADRHGGPTDEPAPAFSGFIPW